jgi:hypothetical protein
LPAAISGILIALVVLRHLISVDLPIATFQFEPSPRPVFPYIIAIFLYILAIIVTFAVKNTKTIGIVLVLISVVTIVLVPEISALVPSASLLIAGIIALRQRKQLQKRKARKALIRFWQHLNEKHDIIEKADKAHSIHEWQEIAKELNKLLRNYEHDLPDDVLHDLGEFTKVPDTSLDEIVPKQIVENYEHLMSEIQHAITKTAQVAIHAGTHVAGAGAISTPLSTTVIAAVVAANIGSIAYASVTDYAPVLPEEKFGLVFDTFIVPGSHNGTFGVYEERGSNVFRPDENIEVYLEYVGITQQPIDDGFGNIRYLTNTTGDFTIADEQGNLVNITDTLSPFDSETHDRRIVNGSGFYVFYYYPGNPPLDPEEYTMTFTITDNLSGERTEIAKDIVISATPLTDLFGGEGNQTGGGSLDVITDPLQDLFGGGGNNN